MGELFEKSFPTPLQQLLAVVDEVGLPTSKNFSGVFLLFVTCNIVHSREVLLCVRANIVHNREVLLYVCTNPRLALRESSRVSG